MLLMGQTKKPDFFKVGGIWVSPMEFKNRLCDHGAVLECAVAGHNDEKGFLNPRPMWF